MKHTSTWKWLRHGAAVLFAATLAASQHAPAVAAAAAASPDMTRQMPSATASHAGRQDPQLGQKIFTGKGNCYTCHGANAKGTPLGPDVTDGAWLNVDGSLEGIEAIVRSGVPAPAKHPAPMPPMGGAKLADDEVKAVAAYVFSLSKK